jgi:fumarate reductase subunit C
MGGEMSRKPYMREMTYRWIFRHPRYLRYMAREFSCVFIGAWTLMMVWGLVQLVQGPAAWGMFLDFLMSPASIVFHVVALGFAVYHSFTWFNLAPKALPLQIGEEFVPEVAIAGAHFAAWAVLSLGVLFLAGAF